MWTGVARRRGWLRGWLGLKPNLIARFLSALTVLTIIGWGQ